MEEGLFMAKVEIGFMKPQTEEMQRVVPGSYEREAIICQSLQSLQKKPILLTPLFWTYGIQNPENKFLLFQATQFVVICMTTSSLPTPVSKETNRPIFMEFKF